MSSKRVNDSTRTMRWIEICIVIAIMLGATIWWFRRPVYPEVSSPESLHLMRALYTACSSQNVDRLAKWRAMYSAVEREGSLTDNERIAFQAILDRATEGDWQLAASESYRFAKDQVR